MRALPRPALVAGAGLVLTVVAGFLLPSSTRPTGWEGAIVRHLRLDRPATMWSVASYFSQFGSGPATVMAAGGLMVGLLLFHQRRLATLSTIAITLGAGGAQVAKDFIDRRIGPHHSLAYPSGHTAGSTAVAATVALLITAAGYSPRMRAVAWTATLAFGAAVGVALVAIGSHYPGDVLGGLSFGLCVPTLVFAAGRQTAARPTASDSVATGHNWPTTPRVDRP